MKAYQNTSSSTGKQFHYNAYGNLGALYPTTKEDQNRTTARMFNSEVETIYRDKASKEDYYKKVKGIYFYS